VTPFFEVGHIRGGLTVEAFKVTELVIVHQVGDHLSNVVSGDAVSDVLTISTAINLTGNRSEKSSWVSDADVTWENHLRVVFIHTAICELLGTGLESGGPGKSRSRVIGTVDVVVLQNLGLVTVVAIAQSGST